jgi:hypothetical protein
MKKKSGEKKTAIRVVRIAGATGPDAEICFVRGLELLLGMGTKVEEEKRQAKISKRKK